MRLHHHHDSAHQAIVALPEFIKQVRLHEARRLMLGEHIDATSAGIRVGYNDAAHFSRDYKKHFGAAPARDVARLRATIGGMLP